MLVWREMATRVYFQIYHELYILVGGGHYIAYGKTSDGWFEYNDSRVSSISESQVQTQDAYLLFYTK